MYHVPVSQVVNKLLASHMWVAAAFNNIFKAILPGFVYLELHIHKSRDIWQTCWNEQANFFSSNIIVI